jgi:hypothetical protein
MKTKVDYGVRILALILAAGGLLGILMSVYAGYTLAQQNMALVLIALAFLCAFAWTMLTGIRLWRGDPRGKTWAKILYGAQIPILTVPGFTYEYYTGLLVGVVGGRVESNLKLQFGASLSLYLDTSIDDLVYGINLFAIAALVYLVVRLRSNTLMQPTGQAAGG